MAVNRNNFSDLQMPLFTEVLDVKIKSPASARNEYGKAAELIASTALGLRTLRINNSAACYDLQGPDGFYECKSVRRTGGCPIWCWRMKKDGDAAKEEGLKIYYVFVLHDAKGAATLADLWRGLAASVKTVLVVPHAIVESVHQTSPFGGIRLGLGESGYDRPGYRDGYRRVAMKSLTPLCDVARPAKFDLFGMSFDLTIFTPKPSLSFTP